eukprot:TRINITY_DN2556_c0_g1_i5.p1 TRINITY_DN2556_c0_g1~~TRINITY_DN2556_c0_g1_i5.p1  ORF type:complete len:221 (-),score=28.63 TRINITY_DN2556_c0_g1_i5:130-792(-)
MDFNREEVRYAITQEIDFSEPSEYSPISSIAKDLLMKLLSKDPGKRISAAEALNHPWFNRDYTFSPLLPMRQRKARRFSSQQVFECSIPMSAKKEQLPNDDKILSKLSLSKKGTCDSLESMPPSGSFSLVFADKVMAEQTPKAFSLTLRSSDTFSEEQIQRALQTNARLRPIIKGFNIYLSAKASSFLTEFLRQMNSQSYIQKIRNIRRDRANSENLLFD